MLFEKQADCDDCRQLREAYDNALRSFSHRLKRLCIPGSRSFNRRVSACNKARERCRAARVAWDEHAARHAAAPDRNVG